MEESASRKREFNSRFGDPESRSGGKLYDLIESHLYSNTQLYSALRERPRMYPIQGHFQRPHGLGPGIVREKTLGGVTSFVPVSC